MGVANRCLVKLLSSSFVLYDMLTKWVLKLQYFSMHSHIYTRVWYAWQCLPYSRCMYSSVYCLVVLLEAMLLVLDPPL